MTGIFIYPKQTDGAMSTIYVGFEMEFKKAENGKELLDYPLILPSEGPTFKVNSSANGESNTRGLRGAKNKFIRNQRNFETSKGWINGRGERRYFDGSPAEISSPSTLLTTDDTFSEKNYLGHLSSLVSSRQTIVELCKDTGELELSLYDLNLSLPDGIKETVENEERLQNQLGFYTPTIDGKTNLSYKDSDTRLEIGSSQFKTAKYQALFDTITTLAYFEILKGNSLRNLHQREYEDFFSDLFKQNKLEFLIPVLEEYHEDREKICLAEASLPFHKDHDRTYQLFRDSTIELSELINSLSPRERITYSLVRI